MRKPSEYIAAAVRNVQSRYMSDSEMRLTCGGSSAMVTRAASVMRGENDVSGENPVENIRVLALASDFENITKGDVATLGESVRIVTSVRTDCAGASQYVGLSAELEKCAAQVFGVRGSRPIRFPVEILAENNGLATDMTDGYAPTTVHSWTLVIAVDSWPQKDEPQIGDEVRFEKDGADVRVKVAKCNRRECHYVINARSR